MAGGTPIGLLYALTRAMPVVGPAVCSTPIGLLLALTRPCEFNPPPVVVEPPPTGGFAPSGERQGKVAWWWPERARDPEPEPRRRKRMRKPKQRAVIMPGPTPAVLAPIIDLIPPYEATQLSDFMGRGHYPADAVQALHAEHERAVREHRMRVEADDEAAVHKLLADDWRTMVDAHPMGPQLAREMEHLKAVAHADWQAAEDQRQAVEHQSRRAAEVRQAVDEARHRELVEALLAKIQSVVERSRKVTVVRGPDGKIAGLANSDGDIVQQVVRDENGQVAGLQ